MMEVVPLELINVEEVPRFINEEPAYQRFAERRQFIDAAFREMAIHETSTMDAFILKMLEAKVEQVKERRPDLNDTDAYIVAGRLLKQLIACYQSALNQLLP